MLKKLSFSVSEKTHKPIATVASILAWLGFFSLVFIMGRTSILTHLEARDILADHSVVDAALTLEKVEEVEKFNGDYKEVFHYIYEYQVNGTNLKKTYIADSYEAEKRLADDTVAIAYSNIEPDRSNLLYILENNRKLGKKILILFGVILLAGFLVMLFYAFITEHLFINRDAPPEETPIEGD